MTTLKSLSELGALLGNGKMQQQAEATFRSRLPREPSHEIASDRQVLATSGRKRQILSDLVAVDPEPPRAA